jgi:hypothetical protein
MVHIIVQCCTIHSYRHLDAARLGNVTKIEFINKVSEQLGMVELNAINKLDIVLLADYRPPNITLHYFSTSPMQFCIEPANHKTEFR